MQGPKFCRRQLAFSLFFANHQVLSNCIDVVLKGRVYLIFKTCMSSSQKWVSENIEALSGGGNIPYQTCLKLWKILLQYRLYWTFLFNVSIIVFISFQFKLNSDLMERLLRFKTIYEIRQKQVLPGGAICFQQMTENLARFEGWKHLLHSKWQS